MNKELRLSVIIPAYNEEGRIGKTLKTMVAFLEQKNFDYEILVIDDGSRDKTKATVRDLDFHSVKVLSYGENRGKGYAVNYGVNQAQGAWILMADADNSTPIEQFDKLFAETDSHRVIIGSRYLPESKIAVSQGVPRIMMSRLGNLLIRLLILPGLHDTQCGFKLFEATAAKEIFAVQSIWRWGFDMEILRIAKERGYKIKEVAITWQNDEQSRIQSSRVFWKTFLELLTVKKNSFFGQYRKAGRSELGLIFRFGAVGAVGTILDYTILNFTHLVLGVNLFPALTLGFLAGAINNYLMNSFWSFEQALSWQKLFRFLSIALVGLVFNNSIVYLLSELSDWNYNLAKLVAIVVVFGWNYFANRRWTFSS